MDAISSTPMRAQALPPVMAEAGGPGKSGTAPGQQAKAAAAAAREARIELPANAQGFAASRIAKGADPATVFAALAADPPAPEEASGETTASPDDTAEDGVASAPDVTTGATGETAAEDTAPVTGEEAAPATAEPAEDPASTAAPPPDDTATSPEEGAATVAEAAPAAQPDAGTEAASLYTVAIDMMSIRVTGGEAALDLLTGSQG